MLASASASLLAGAALWFLRCLVSWLLPPPCGCASPGGDARPGGKNRLRQAFLAERLPLPAERTGVSLGIAGAAVVVAVVVVAMGEIRACTSPLLIM